MRSIAILGFSLFFLGGAAQAKLCELDGISLKLTPELLEGVGYEPDSQFLSYVMFHRLQVQFGPIETHELEIDRRGNTRPIRLVPISIDVYGSVRSAREEYLEKLLQQSSELIKISASGGYMRIVDSSTIQLLATLTIRKYAKVLVPIPGVGLILRDVLKIKFVHVATARIPVWLEATMSLTNSGDDVNIRTSLRRGASDVDATWLTGLQLLPSMASLLVEDLIESTVDLGAERATDRIRRALPGVGSVNEVFPDSGSTLVSIMKELKFTKDTGFEGTNPDVGQTGQDSEVEVRLSKATNPEDARSFISEKSACQLVHELQVWKRVIEVADA